MRTIALNDNDTEDSFIYFRIFIFIEYCLHLILIQYYHTFQINTTTWEIIFCAFFISSILFCRWRCFVTITYCYIRDDIFIHICSAFLFPNISFGKRQNLLCIGITKRIASSAVVCQLSNSTSTMEDIIVFLKIEMRDRLWEIALNLFFANEWVIQHTQYKLQISKSLFLCIHAINCGSFFIKLPEIGDG